MDAARADGLVRARAGVTAIFFANGLCIGAWAVAIPEIKALFGLSDARLSIVLLAAGVGGARRHAGRRRAAAKDRGHRASAAESRDR